MKRHVGKSSPVISDAKAAGASIMANCANCGEMIFRDVSDAEYRAYRQNTLKLLCSECENGAP